MCALHIPGEGKGWPAGHIRTALSFNYNDTPTCNFKKKKRSKIWHTQRGSKNSNTRLQFFILFSFAFVFLPTIFLPFPHLLSILPTLKPTLIPSFLLPKYIPPTFVFAFFPFSFSSFVLLIPSFLPSFPQILTSFFPSLHSFLPSEQLFHSCILTSFLPFLHSNLLVRLPSSLN